MPIASPRAQRCVTFPSRHAVYPVDLLDLPRLLIFSITIIYSIFYSLRKCCGSEAVPCSSTCPFPFQGLWECSISIMNSLCSNIETGMSLCNI